MKTLLRKAPSLNTYEGIYDRLSSKASFNHDEWIHAANEGTLDMYASAIDKFESLGIDYQKYKDDLNLSFADTRTRMTALYNEVYADRENQKERERTVTDENGVPRVEKYLASDYDYNKELIKSQNDYREEVERQRIADEAKDSAGFFENLGWGTLGIFTGLSQGFLNGINQLESLIQAGVGWIVTGGKTDFAKDVAMWQDDNALGELSRSIAEFETKYSTLRYSNGDYTNLGKYIGGASTSIGEMVPSMLIASSVGGALSGTRVPSSTAGKITSGVSQATFYAGMFSGSVGDMYKQFQIMGADVDSSSIVANAAIKSVLQWGIEKTLGKILGTGPTTIDEIFFGRARNPVGRKIGGWKAFGHILQEAGQEGLEEVLQDTSDFLVNEGFSNYIDAYGVNNEINFQSLFDAFVIGAMVSVAGSAVDVLKTRRVIGADGKKLGKLASWEYGINMESFAKNISEVMDKAGKVNYETDNRSKDLIQAAALEAYASYRLVTSIYQEIGDERFKAANEVLDKITEQIQSGKFNKENVTSYVENMREQFGHISNLALEKMVSELKKKNVKEVKRTIKADDVKKDSGTKEKLTPKQARDKLEELFEASGAKTVTETDGNPEVEKDGNIVIGTDRLNNESINEILQNLSVQKLVSHLSELSNKERIRSNMSDVYEEYYGRKADEDADIISLLFDADFFKAVLMKSNKDVFKYLSYFAEAEKSLVRGKRRDEIYRNKINEIRNHWFNHLADYCIIHEEANPTMFLNYISDAKKRKEIENKVKKGRWGTDIYNRVLLSESNLDKLSENEKVVLKTRFDNAFAKNIATRHWNNVNSNNAKARQQSMNALSNKYQGLFSSKYDGVTYMPDISVGNRVFNKFMQSLGLDLSTLLNKNYLTESDVKLIVDDYGKVDENSILNFRKAQFKEMSTVYDFSINRHGHFEVSHKGKIVGFSKYRKLQKDIEKGKKADTFVTDAKVKSDRLSKLINTDLITTSASYYAIDDVITNPELLKSEVANEIVKFANDKYGLKLTRPTADTTFLYLRNYFLSEFKDMTIVMSNNGEFVFASVKKIADLFKNPNVKITKDTKLNDIIEDKYLPEGLNLKIVEGWDGAKYVPYKNIEKDGATITVLDNTIYIGDGIFADGDDYVRFAFAHEFQHALQFINNINSGADYSWISKVSDKQRKEIIADVRQHKPELFKGIKAGTIEEASVVNDYVYHSTAESDAYGLQGNEVLDFVPVLSKNDKNVLTFVMPWGTIHKIKGVEKADVISSIWKKEADNIWHFTDILDLNQNLNMDQRIDDWRVQTGRYNLRKGLSASRQALTESYAYRNTLERLTNEQRKSSIYPLIEEWKRLPMNTSGAFSETKKSNLKSAITDNDKAVSLQLLHHIIAPEMDFSEFVNTDVNFVRMQKRGHLGNSPFVSIYAGATQDSIRFCLEGFVQMSSHPEDVEDTNLIIGTFKPKDTLLYFATNESEVLIEPSKLVNSKVFKCNNRMIIDADPYNNTTIAILNDEKIIDPVYISNSANDNFILMSDFTGEVIREGSFDKYHEIEGMKVYSFGRKYSIDETFELYEKDINTLKQSLKGSTYNFNGYTIPNVIKARDEDNNEYILNVASGDFYTLKGNLDVAVTDPNGRTITPEETETSLAELESLYGMSLKRTPKYLKEDDPRAKDFISIGARPNHQYKERLYELNEDGTQKLDKQGKPIYHYVPSEKKSRYVSKRKYAGTKLEPFAKSYKRTQMPIELQNFILNAKDLDPYLQERIDGKLKGTLTEQDVFDYLRSKNDIDDNTFKQINEAFFQNKYIDNFSELKRLIEHEMRESWAIYRMFNLDEKLKANKVLLDTEGISFDYLYELIERNEKYRKTYAELLSQFDEYHGKSFEINEAYARMRYMRNYDGTISSERDVGSIVRLAAILNWNTTKKTNKFDIAESYSEVIEDLNIDKESMIEAIKMRELTKKAKELLAEGKSYEEAKMESLVYVMNLVDELDNMSISEVKSKYSGEDVDKMVVEGMVVDALGNYVAIPDQTPKVTPEHLVNRTKGLINSVKKILTQKEIDDVVKDNSDLFEKDMKLKRKSYQNEIPNKTRQGYHYRNKSVEEVQEVFDKVAEICDRIREEKRIGKANVDAQDKQIRELQRKIKQLERDKKNQKADKIPKVYEIILEDERVEIEYNKEIPNALRKILQVHYSKTSKSKVQNLSTGNERHIRVSGTLFYEENADNFNNLTQSDVDEIIDFYLTTDVPFNDATAAYRTAMIWTLTYIVEVGRKGNINFVIDANTLDKVEKRLRQTVSRASIDLRAWNTALKRLNPEKVIANSIARRTGVDIPEADINRLVEAVESRDMKEVEKVKREIYESLLAKSNRKRDILDKLLQYERLAMLSGPGTWLRNLTSNLLVTGVNRLSDGMNGKLEKVLNKLFPKSQYIEGQYKISGTKVTKQVSDYIETNLIKNGLLAKIISSLNKYDFRKSATGKSNDVVLASMIADSVCREFSHQPLFNDKVFGEVEKFILKMISDDAFVIKAAKGYLGKMITEDLETGRIKSPTEFFTQNGISKEFMTYVAEAFKLASYDYMHKPNIIFEFESKLAKKSKGAYFAYKQIFPFVGASWNWFVEGLKYSPVGLAKAIVNYAKLENTIEKYERKRQTFAHGDVGVSSDFAKYLTQRDITKGIIGTVGYIIGALLVGFGVAKLDEEDYKYKLYFGKDKNVVIDVSDVYGTQGIFLGMSLTSTLIDSLSDRDGVFDDILDITSATLDQMFIDSTFADFFNTFRYSQNFGDWLTYQPVNVANMFVPNFLKTLTSLFTPHKINYGTGFLGKVGRLATSVFPGLPYLFPTYYDPYTGEKQIPQKLWLLTSLATKLTPVDLSIYNISDMERIAIQEGVHKSQLTGRYKINDEEVKLSIKQIKALNELYGQLNSVDLKELQYNSKTYKVKQANGTFKNLRWSQMTDKEKATVIDRIMTDNSGYAKIYILTDSGEYKYFATDAEFKALRALGITKNIYRKNNKYSGFVKAN